MWCLLFFLQRRRDRINEKMKALQELVPHCNKVESQFWVLVTFEFVLYLWWTYHPSYKKNSERQGVDTRWSNRVLEVPAIASSGSISHFRFPISPHLCKIIVRGQSIFSTPYSAEGVASGSDHVDDYRDGADDVPRCSPAHAADGNGLEPCVHAHSTEPEPAAKSSTIHEQSSPKSNASGPASSYRFSQRVKPDAERWCLRADKSFLAS